MKTYPPKWAIRTAGTLQGAAICASMLATGSSPLDAFMMVALVFIVTFVLPQLLTGLGSRVDREIITIIAMLILMFANPLGSLISLCLVFVIGWSFDQMFPTRRRP